MTTIVMTVTTGIRVLLPLVLVGFLEARDGRRQVPEFPLADFSLFKEPDLASYSNSKQGVEAYRVFVIPTFASALCVRVERQGGKSTLLAKALSGKGGYEWGKIKKQSERIISPTEWNQLINRLAGAAFWSIPETGPPGAGSSRTDRACVDGTTWIIEGISGEKYRKVSRYCPSADFQSVGNYFLQLAGWKIGEV
jgi:hypothetical protein